LVGRDQCQEVGRTLLCPGKQQQASVSVTPFVCVLGLILQPVFDQLIFVGAQCIFVQHQPNSVMHIPNRTQQVLDIFRGRFPAIGHTYECVGVVVGKDRPGCIGVQHHSVTGLTMSIQSQGSGFVIIFEETPGIIRVQSPALQQDHRTKQKKGDDTAVAAQQSCQGKN